MHPITKHHTHKQASKQASFIYNIPSWNCRLRDCMFCLHRLECLLRERKTQEFSHGNENPRSVLYLYYEQEHKVVHNLWSAKLGAVSPLFLQKTPFVLWTWEKPSEASELSSPPTSGFLTIHGNQRAHLCGPIPSSLLLTTSSLVTIPALPHAHTS